MIALGEIIRDADGHLQPRARPEHLGALVGDRRSWWRRSLTALFAKPKVILTAFRAASPKKRAGARTSLRHIELPLWISFVGVPIVGLVGVVDDRTPGSACAGTSASSPIPLIVLLTLIAANSTALTGITPTGSLSKIPQFLFGAHRSAKPRRPT